MEVTQTKNLDNVGKDESVSSNIKKICYEKGIFKPDGFLDPNLLFKAFKEKLMDVEDFKAALKWTSYFLLKKYNQSLQYK